MLAFELYLSQGPETTNLLLFGHEIAGIYKLDNTRCSLILRSGGQYQVKGILSDLANRIVCQHQVKN